jgi:hypothetical protein
MAGQLMHAFLREDYLNRFDGFDLTRAMAQDPERRTGRYFEAKASGRQARVTRIRKSRTAREGRGGGPTKNDTAV